MTTIWVACHLFTTLPSHAMPSWADGKSCNVLGARCCYSGVWILTVWSKGCAPARSSFHRRMGHKTNRQTRTENDKKRTPKTAEKRETRLHSKSFWRSWIVAGSYLPIFGSRISTSDAPCPVSDSLLGHGSRIPSRVIEAAMPPISCAWSPLHLPPVPKGVYVASSLHASFRLSNAVIAVVLAAAVSATLHAKS